MFFSVNRPMRIGGDSFHTCICYEAKENMLLTLRKLKDEGSVELYEDRVSFVNGAVVKKANKPKAAVKVVKKEANKGK